MNYLYFGIGVFVALCAVVNIGKIFRVAFTSAQYESAFRLAIDAAMGAFCTTLAYWDFTMAVQS